MDYRHWAKEEKATATAMRAAGHTFREISKALTSRSETGVRSYFRKRPDYKKLYQRGTPRHGMGQVKPVRAPLTILEDRDRRSNEPRTITQLLLGDPPFSQSALGKRLSV